MVLFHIIAVTPILAIPFQKMLKNAKSEKTRQILTVVRQVRPKSVKKEEKQGPRTQNTENRTQKDTADFSCQTSSKNEGPTTLLKLPAL